MKTIHTSIKAVLLVLTTLALSATFSRADTYSARNLQSDIPGLAANVDPNLVNPWGMAVPSPTGPTSPIWVSDNGTGVSTLYNQTDGTALSLVVTIPTSARNKDGGNSTGVVFNGTSSFNVTLNGITAPARFIFVSEDGSISGWNPALNPNDRGHAIAIAVDNGTNLGSKRAIYKSATLGVANGNNFLYVTNFHTARVETYDENFHQVNPNGFIDPNLPAGYAPFGIRNFGDDKIYVTYALQDAKAEDDVAGPGNGFVNVFDTSGNFVKRLISNGKLNAPWGLALVEGELWVGNFGDGTINNYDPADGTFIETITKADGKPLQIDGLWDLLPLPFGTSTAVYFSAGIADEAHGLFGRITED
jgi:uncharacterized protein (TIGR03118 family)